MLCSKNVDATLKNVYIIEKNQWAFEFFEHIFENKVQTCVQKQMLNMYVKNVKWI